MTLTRLELANRMRCQYPNRVTDDTQSKRMCDIVALQTLIGTSINTNDLSYGGKEEILLLFHTQKDEKIAIQYPGKESSLANNKRRPYDFRPKIILTDGRMVRDLNFSDLWQLLESVGRNCNDLLKSIAALFFQMGRMTMHSLVDEAYEYSIVAPDGSVVDSGTRQLNWYKLSIPEEIIDSFNFNALEVPIDDDISISFEAFALFFEMILQNEDSKYYDKKHNLQSGRIPTSDSMLLLASNLNGCTPVSTLLQRFVDGYGIAKCKIDEITPATSDLIEIVDRKTDLINYLDTESIVYRQNSAITVNGTHISVTLKIPSCKIAILTKKDAEKVRLLESRDWKVFSISDISADEVYNSVIESINH